MKTASTAKLLMSLFATGVIVIALTSATTRIGNYTPWIAPVSADTMKNPFKDKPEAIAAGKKLYSQFCVVCHGEKGKGDGIAAANLTPKPADHSLPAFQKQTDGAIYWKMTKGRAPMAGYEKSLTSTQRWQLVSYIRTLKSK